MRKKGTLFFAGSKATPPQRGLVQLVCTNMVVISLLSIDVLLLYTHIGMYCVHYYVEFSKNSSNGF